jgi:YfiH family protein
MTQNTPPLPTIEAPLLTTAKNVRHAFFTREGGVSGGLYQSLNCGFGSDDEPANVTENRRRVCGALDVQAPALVTPYQVHGTHVAVVEQPWSRDAAPKADGLATCVPGIALGILTADCAPVLFADRDAGVIGACHAGWRGALDGIIDATLAAMTGLGARRPHIYAAIGPCIAQTSYQVGPEFRDRFLAADDANDKFFKADDEERYRFDLPGFVSERLNRAGIANASWVGLDTCTDDRRLFSYRRSTHKGDADFGRGLSAIVLAEP